MKTFIKWPGNKSKFLRYIIPELPHSFNTYIEPFLGSGAVFLSLCPDKSIINDINTDLIDIWKLIQKDICFIIETFKNFEKRFVPLTKSQKLAFCRKITNHLNTETLSDLRSVKLLLMSYCVYMGAILINNRYRFQGLEKRIFVDDKYFFLNETYYNNLFQIHSFLNGSSLENSHVKIYNKDYKDVLKMAKKGDFVYLDPPYYFDYQKGFNYNIQEDKVDDDAFVNELLFECKKLDKKGVQWLMTQSDTHKIKHLFEKFTIIPYKVYKPFKKIYAHELIIKNY